MSPSDDRARSLTVAGAIAVSLVWGLSCSFEPVQLDVAPCSSCGDAPGPGDGSGDGAIGDGLVGDAAPAGDTTVACTVDGQEGNDSEDAATLIAWGTTVQRELEGVLCAPDRDFFQVPLVTNRVLGWRLENVVGAPDASLAHTDCGGGAFDLCDGTPCVLTPTSATQWSEVCSEVVASDDTSYVFSFVDGGTCAPRLGDDIWQNATLYTNPEGISRCPGNTDWYEFQNVGNVSISVTWSTAETFDFDLEIRDNTGTPLGVYCFGQAGRYACNVPLPTSGPKNQTIYAGISMLEWFPTASQHDYVATIESAELIYDPCGGGCGGMQICCLGGGYCVPRSYMMACF